MEFSSSNVQMGPMDTLLAAPATEACPSKVAAPFKNRTPALAAPRRGFQDVCFLAKCTSLFQPLELFTALGNITRYLHLSCFCSPHAVPQGRSLLHGCSQQGKSSLGPEATLP